MRDLRQLAWGWSGLPLLMCQRGTGQSAEQGCAGELSHAAGPCLSVPSAWMRSSIDCLSDDGVDADMVQYRQLHGRHQRGYGLVRSTDDPSDGTISAETVEHQSLRGRHRCGHGRVQSIHRHGRGRAPISSLLGRHRREYGQVPITSRTMPSMWTRSSISHL